MGINGGWQYAPIRNNLTIAWGQRPTRVVTPSDRNCGTNCDNSNFYGPNGPEFQCVNDWTTNYQCGVHYFDLCESHSQATCGSVQDGIWGDITNACQWYDNTMCGPQKPGLAGDFWNGYYYGNSANSSCRNFPIANTCGQGICDTACAYFDPLNAWQYYSSPSSCNVTCPAFPTCSVSGPTSIAPNTPTSYTISQTSAAGLGLYSSPQTSPNSWTTSCQHTTDLSCSPQSISLAAGSYWVVCNGFNASSQCTGNPWCNFNGANSCAAGNNCTDCPGWTNCGPNSRLLVTVTPPCTPTCTITTSPQILSLVVGTQGTINSNVNITSACGSVSSVSWNSSNSTVASVTTPGSSTTVTAGSTIGTTNVSATAALSPNGSCTTSGTGGNSGPTIVTVTQSYFVTYGGNVTSKGRITDIFLPAGKFISGK